MKKLFVILMMVFAIISASADTFPMEMSIIFDEIFSDSDQLMINDFIDAFVDNIVEVDGAPMFKVTPLNFGEGTIILKVFRSSTDPDVPAYWNFVIIYADRNPRFAAESNSGIIFLTEEFNYSIEDLAMMAHYFVASSFFDLYETYTSSY